MPALDFSLQLASDAADIPELAQFKRWVRAALRVAALTAGEDIARQIKLYIEYAPEPPFPGGTPETSPAPVLEAVNTILRPTVSERAAIVSRLHRRLFPHD